MNLSEARKLVGLDPSPTSAELSPDEEKAVLQLCLLETNERKDEIPSPLDYLDKHVAVYSAQFKWLSPGEFPTSFREMTPDEKMKLRFAFRQGFHARAREKGWEDLLEESEIVEKKVRLPDHVRRMAVDILSREPWFMRMRKFENLRTIEIMKVAFAMGYWHAMMYEKRFLRRPFQESIVSPTKDTLDLKIFDRDEGGKYVMKDDVRLQILQEAKKYEQWGDVEGVFVIGSILSFQWSPTSDIDTTIVLEPYDEKSLEEATQYAINSSDQNFVEGTKHPINCYVKLPEEVDWDLADGVYDAVKNEWIKGPYSIAADVGKYINSFEELVHSLDITFGELKRDIIDYEELAQMSEGSLKQLKRLTKEKVEEIDDAVQLLADQYEDIHTARAGIFSRPLTPEEIREYGRRQLLPPNVIYKLLERYHYMELLKAVRGLLREAGGEIEEPEQVGELAKVLDVEEESLMKNVIAKVDRRIRKLVEQETVSPEEYWGREPTPEELEVAKTAWQDYKEHSPYASREEREEWIERYARANGLKVGALKKVLKEAKGRSRLNLTPQETTFVKRWKFIHDIRPETVRIRADRKGHKYVSGITRDGEKMTTRIRARLKPYLTRG